MKRKPERPGRDGPQAATGTPSDTTAGRDPANRPKKFRVFGTDTTTGKKSTIVVTAEEEPALGSRATGIDVESGKTVTLKVSGREPANCAVVRGGIG